MKTLFLLYSLILAPLTFSQEICLVSADFQSGENLIVMWEWPASTVGMDSILVYRKTANSGGFIKIGGTPVGQLGTFVDQNAVTYEESFYRISYKYTNGTESSPSLWHKPLMLDYGIQPGTTNYGYINWTPYEIEAETSNAYIVQYICYSDPTGLGNFSEMSIMPNTVLGWFDQAYLFNPNTNYVVEAELPNCDIVKANINTSRSNIKKQIPNAEVGIETLLGQDLSISPNPVHDVLTISDVSSVETITIIDCHGSIAYTFQNDEISTKLDVSDLEPGVYLLQTNHLKGTISTQKLVKY